MATPLVIASDSDPTPGATLAINATALAWPYRNAGASSADPAVAGPTINAMPSQPTTSVRAYGTRRTRPPVRPLIPHTPRDAQLLEPPSPCGCRLLRRDDNWQHPL